MTSIEAARSHMEVLDDLNAVGFANSVGPGVYDIHSPRVPSAEEMAESLRAALQGRSGAERLWVNPDCGLKTAEHRRGDRVAAEHGRRRPRGSGGRLVPPRVRLRQHLDRHVVGPGLPGHHVGDFDYAALEFAGRRVHQAVGLRLLMDRLRVE